MASRYQEGTTESLYISHSQDLGEGADTGFAYNLGDPVCSCPNEIVPRVSDNKILGDRIYHDEVGKIGLNAGRQWLIAFARGDDEYLAVALSQASGQMDRVFRAPLMLKMSGVLNSGLGWHPKTPKDAIELMKYLSDRASFELQQAERREFHLKDFNHQLLKGCCKDLKTAVESCKEFRLFTRDEGWLFDEPYSELWNNQWRLRHNSKTAPATPATPAAAAVVTASVPTTAQIRTPLPTRKPPATRPSTGMTPLSQTHQLGQKRSRSKSPSSAPPSKTVKVAEKYKDMAPEQPGGGVRGAAIPSQDKLRVKAKGADRTIKTVKEQAKGAELDDEALGQDATHSCAACAKSKSKKCRVATDPHIITFDSFKCNNCISGKLGNCFTVDNPGIQYAQETLEAMRLRQARKRREGGGSGRKGGSSVGLDDAARE